LCYVLTLVRSDSRPCSDSDSCGDDEAYFCTYWEDSNNSSTNCPERLASSCDRDWCAPWPGLRKRCLSLNHGKQNVARCHYCDICKPGEVCTFEYGRKKCTPGPPIPDDTPKCNNCGGGRECMYFNGYHEATCSWKCTDETCKANGKKKRCLDVLGPHNHGHNDRQGMCFTCDGCKPGLDCTFFHGMQVCYTATKPTIGTPNSEELHGEL